MHIDKGANVQHCQSVSGQMYTHIIFERGANVRGDMSYTRLMLVGYFACKELTILLYMSDVEIIRDVGIVLSPLSHLVSGLAFKVNLNIAQNTTRKPCMNEPILVSARC